MDTTTSASNAPYTDGQTTVIIHPRYRAALNTVLHLPDIFDTEGITLYRGRNVVKRFDTDNGTWVVKRYKRPNRVQRIAYTFFKKSKAERAYHYAWLMRERGIDTPEGIACILQKHNRLLQDSYFVATLCTYRPVFPELVPTEHYDQQLAHSLAAFLVHMHRQGVMHGDLNLNNILYSRLADGQWHFCVIDTNRSLVTKDGVPLELTQREYDLIRFLAAQPGKAFSREALMEHVWNYAGYVGDVRGVDVAVRRLREKLEDDPANPKFIITRRGLGYLFAE